MSRLSTQAQSPDCRREVTVAGAGRLDLPGSIASACRLCGGPTAACFVLAVMAKYRVEYLRCERCGSLQTEKPYWLGEAYAHNLSHLDTGAAQRNTNNLAACYAVAKLFGLRKVLDMGGGDGLLCRLLRDYGINCFVKDKYAAPSYAQGFSEPDFDQPDLVIASELLEHLADPGAELDEIFGPRPPVLLVTTAIYSGQGTEWWYLAPEAGQHVFFYSRSALELIATRYGYALLLSGGFILFIRKERFSATSAFFAWLLLRGRILSLIKAFLALSPAPGAWRDHLRQKARSDAR